MDPINGARADFIKDSSEAFRSITRAGGSCLAIGSPACISSRSAGPATPTASMGSSGVSDFKLASKTIIATPRSN